MNKVIIAILSLTIVTGCSDDNDGAPNRITVSLIQHIDAEVFDKTVILYEDDAYRIATYFDKYISSYPFGVLPDYDEMKQQASLDVLTQDTLLMQNYVKHSGDTDYTLAFHLENGSCLIFDKKRQEIVSTIQVEKFADGGPMTTTAGRRFYINGVLLLETIDMIS